MNLQKIFCMYAYGHVLGQADNILQTGSKQSHVLYKKGMQTLIDWYLLLVGCTTV